MVCQDEFYTAQEELGTMIINDSGFPTDGTTVIASDTMIEHSGTMIENSGTMIENSGTMIEMSGTMIENSGTMIETDLGTMVINDDTDDSTMRSKANFCSLRLFTKGIAAQKEAEFTAGH